MAPASSRIGSAARVGIGDPVGSGLVRSDLLVVNKTDLAPHVGVDLPRMLAEAETVRGGRPVVATSLRFDRAVPKVADAICEAVLLAS